VIKKRGRRGKKNGLTLRAKKRLSRMSMTFTWEKYKRREGGGIRFCRARRSQSGNSFGEKGRGTLVGDKFSEKKAHELYGNRGNKGTGVRGEKKKSLGTASSRKKRGYKQELYRVEPHEENRKKRGEEGSQLWRENFTLEPSREEAFN